MSQETTNRMLTSSFKGRVQQRGFIASGIKTQKDREVNKETQVRYELQTTIKQMIAQRQSVDKIKEKLMSNKEYEKYASFFDIWIKNKIIKDNNKIDRILRKVSSQKNVVFEEIIEEIREQDSEYYNIYEKEISERVKEMFQIREQELERIKEKQKNSEEEQR